MKKATIIAICPIVLFVVVLIVGVWIKRRVEQKTLFHNYASDFSSQKDLRKSIEIHIGCQVPERAKNLFMARDGFQDSTFWVTFTVESVDLKSLKSDISDTWTNQLVWPLPRRIPESVRNWWNPPSTNISVFWDCGERANNPVEREVSGTLWIIDETRGVVYCCRYSS